MNSRNYFNFSTPICKHPKLKDGFSVKGFAEILVYEKGQLVDRICRSNIIFNQGKAEIIESLVSGSNRVLARMAIGGKGTLPSDPTVPKSPVATQTELYAEIYRQDVETTSVTTVGDTNEVLLVTTFRAVDIPISAYPDQVNPVVNEVGLVMIDLITGAQLPRVPVASPDSPDADESVFSLRTFKSVPFEAANETAVTVRYTIFLG